MFVADASTSINWFVQEETSEAAARALKRARRCPIAVPSLWLSETQSAIIKLVRQKRIEPAEAREIRTELALLSKRIDTSVDQDTVDRIWEIASMHMLTIYDATYVELAWRLKLEIASEDDAICAAARKLGLTLI